MKNKTILCDVDNVILDLNSAWINLYNNIYNDNLKYSDILDWEMHKFVKAECGHDIYKILHDNSDIIYRNCELVKGSVFGIELLEELGFNIVYCTSGIMPAKIEALARHGLIPNDYRSKMWPKNVVIATNKHLINGLLIDDYHKNIKSGDILLTQPWNLNKDHCGVRADSWHEIVNIIISKLTEK